MLRAAAFKKPVADKAGPSLAVPRPKNTEVELRLPSQFLAGTVSLHPSHVFSFSHGQRTSNLTPHCFHSIHVCTETLSLSLSLAFFFIHSPVFHRSTLFLITYWLASRKQLLLKPNSTLRPRFQGHLADLLFSRRPVFVWVRTHGCLAPSFSPGVLGADRPAAET